MPPHRFRNIIAFTLLDDEHLPRFTRVYESLARIYLEFQDPFGNCYGLIYVIDPFEALAAKLPLFENTL